MHRVLVVGASGKVAHHVVSELHRRGARVRGMIRHPEDAARVKALGADETVMADLGDAASLDAALAGVERAFYLAPAFMPDEANVGRRFVAAARERGVRRIVFSSVIHPVIGALVNHAAKAPVEEAILDSGLEYAFLHPALFFQNLEASFQEVAKTGVFGEPWSCDTRFSRVDYRDVAEVAAIALTEDRLLHGTFELASEGWLDRHGVAALMSEALGRSVVAKRIHPPANAPPPMKAMFAHYDRIGLRGSPLTLRAILGREPRTLAAFLQELARSHGAA